MDVANEVKVTRNFAERVVDVTAHVVDNVWAFLLFTIAGGLALVAHCGRDKDLLGFSSTVAMTGAALFHGKKD